MILYHLSQTLKLGDTLVRDHQRLTRLSEPFLQGLERGEDCFAAMVLNAKYTYELLGRYHLREWSDYAKWATEGAFEFVRRTEFPQCVSRLDCGFYYAGLSDSRKLYEYDWGEETEEERQKVHLFEMEVDDERPDQCDMLIYDEAYDAMSDRQDIETVLLCARRYFAGEAGQKPVWELLSRGKAVAVKDMTHFLR